MNLSDKPNVLKHISDFFFTGHLGAKLQEYVDLNFSKVKLLRTPQRQGLIRARVYGADHATGEVSIF